MFGAVGDAMVQEWAGVMAWAFPPDSAAVWPGLFAKVRAVAMTSLPTRIVLCMEQDTKAEEQLQRVNGAQLFCSIPRGAMPLVDPRAFSRGPLRCRGLRSGQAFQIYIIENQAARDRAPVDVSRLVEGFNQWCIRNGVQCGTKAVAKPTEISTPMSILSHWWLYARAVSCHRRGCLNWFDDRDNIDPLIASVARHPSAKIQKMLEDVAKYDKYTGALGFLPSALRKLLGEDGKNMTKEQRRAAQERVAILSQTVFLGSFRLWMDRRRRAVAWSRISAVRAVERVDAAESHETNRMCLRSGPIRGATDRGARSRGRRGRRGRARGRGRGRGRAAVSVGDPQPRWKTGASKRPWQPSASVALGPDIPDGIGDARGRGGNRGRGGTRGRARGPGRGRGRGRGRGSHRRRTPNRGG